MSMGTIILIAALIACVTYLLIALSPPPLYGPPEKNGREMEPPDSQKRQ